ncbi:endopeptidase [Glaesserella parasuis]|uniref:NlpC/P60 family protein n=1 Tax=Glaesserella parasuis TaxID=738 RepID=UPI001365824E|nr:NlpC/P60 family protein [Glaesserella parasuis]MWP83065.1 endopeptidase [Glaesserella parasuis]
MFYQLIKKHFSLCTMLLCAFLLSACVSKITTVQDKSGNKHKGQLSDSIFVISSLSEHQREWEGTRYRLGGITKSGIDCSGFVQLTFRELFGIDLPRITVDQAKAGIQISKSELRTGDLVFFKTGRGPNGRHVGIYVKNGQFLHASTKGGVIYSDINSPYWSRSFWQARRL